MKPATSRRPFFGDRWLQATLRPSSQFPTGQFVTRCLAHEASQAIESSCRRGSLIELPRLSVPSRDLAAGGPGQGGAGATGCSMRCSICTIVLRGLLAARLSRLHAQKIRRGLPVSIKLCFCNEGNEQLASAPDLHSRQQATAGRQTPCS